MLLFFSRNRCLRFLDEGGKVNADAASDAQHEFHGRIAKPVVHEAQHGFRYAGRLRDRIIREFAPFPFFTQKANDLGTDGLVVASFRHI